MGECFLSIISPQSNVFQALQDFYQLLTPGSTVSCFSRRLAATVQMYAEYVASCIIQNIAESLGRPLKGQAMCENSVDISTKARNGQFGLGPPDISLTTSQRRNCGI
jgi:hypothetical protein